MKRTYTKKQWIMLIAGLLAICTGLSILGFFGIRKICRMVKKQKLLRENIILEIPDLHIKAPVLEGTDNEILAKAVGHFPETGSPGSGNYCIAGHSSTLYKEYFNNLKHAENGMEIRLYDMARTCWTYKISDSFIVEPNEVWILDDTGDNRITLVTCTDDGSQRLCITALLDRSEQPASES